MWYFVPEDVSGLLSVVMIIVTFPLPVLLLTVLRCLVGAHNEKNTLKELRELCTRSLSSLLGLSSSTQKHS